MRIAHPEYSGSAPGAPKTQRAKLSPRSLSLHPGRSPSGAHHPTPALNLVSYRSPGSMIAANAFLALFSRDFTVPRLHAVISAISS